MTQASAVVGTQVPYRLTRIGMLMSPAPDDPFEAMGVLNPASGRDPGGRLMLLPRVVADGHVSRVALAEVELRDGVPAGVLRRGVVLGPDEGWERGARNAGVEDPRVTWIPTLGRHVMTYVAYGPLGPRLALAISEDLHHWRRLGPVHFTYQADLDTDLGLFPNKDAVFFPEPVVGPDGRPSYAMLHRPMWDLSWIRPHETINLPAGLTDPRPGIWISYVPVDRVAGDVGALPILSHHRSVALPRYPYEQVKIGAGPPPLRVPEGWLLLHHGVRGSTPRSFEDSGQHGVYSVGAMLLAADDPSRVLARTRDPLLEPLTPEERSGTVTNVVFPTAIEEVGGVRFVFYGMADSTIGVARLDHL
jgi:beta-1,2-mannobiose phosphorylase / 1,2-beta-oligomannan phosphorylase